MSHSTEATDLVSAFKAHFSNTDASPGVQRAAFRSDPCGILGSSECKIVRCERGVRKFGPRVRIEESLALKLAFSLRLPVPEVHEVVCPSENQVTEILMEFVDGECLEEAWKSMNMDQKRDIALQIRGIVYAMRQASATDKTIGAFGSPVRDCRQYSDYTGGPFNSEAEFNETFVLDLLKGTPSLVRSAIADALPIDSRVVFTHGDLTPRNIIVKDGRVQAILDWEYAGWFPEYWEYVKFFDRPTHCKDWKEFAEVIFETKYAKDLLTFQTLARWQRP